MQLFTIVDKRTARPFILQRDKQRPALVAFHAYPSAHFVARALEYREHKLGAILQRCAWNELDEITPAPFSLKAPKHLAVCKWASTVELVHECTALGVNLMYCSRVGVENMKLPLELIGHTFDTGA